MLMIIVVYLIVICDIVVKKPVVSFNSRDCTLLIVKMILGELTTYAVIFLSVVTCFIIVHMIINLIQGNFLDNLYFFKIVLFDAVSTCIFVQRSTSGYGIHCIIQVNLLELNLYLPIPMTACNSSVRFTIYVNFGFLIARLFQ